MKTKTEPQQLPQLKKQTFNKKEFIKLAQKVKKDYLKQLEKEEKNLKTQHEQLLHYWTGFGETPKR